MNNKPITTLKTAAKFDRCSTLVRPAFYRDAIATRDVKKLKEVFLFEIFSNWYKILSNEILMDILFLKNILFIIV